MFIASYDTPAIARHVRLIWSCLDMSREALEKCLTQLPTGCSLLVRDDMIDWMRGHAAQHNLLRQGHGGIERLRPDGSVAETMALYEHCLPSQIVDHPARSVVALDIVLKDSTEEAWDETETLIDQGLPSQVAASALVGTAQEIAQRLNDYRKLGLFDVILTAPPSRAPYHEVSEALQPLLRQQAIPVDRHARIAGISDGPFEWHGAAL